VGEEISRAKKKKEIKIKNTNNQYDCNKKPADVLIRLSGCESDERPCNRAHLSKEKSSLIVVLPCMLTITQLLLQQYAHFYY
jgi:hypothetical protein